MPQLIAATKPIELSFPDNLTLSLDGKFLYAAYRSLNGVFVFDVQQMINTVQNPPQGADLTTTPVDVLNTAIIARTPIGAGGLPQGMETDVTEAPPPLQAAFTMDEGYFFVDDTGTFTIRWTNTTESTENTDINKKNTLQFTVLLEEKEFLGQFIEETDVEGLTRPSALEPGESSGDIRIHVKALLDQWKEFDHDVLYGASITIVAHRPGTDPTNPANQIGTQTSFVYRLVDASDTDFLDALLEMPDTTVDAQGGAVSKRKLEYRMPQSMRDATTFTTAAQDFSFDTQPGSNFANFVFDPQQEVSQPPAVFSLSTPGGLLTEINGRAPGSNILQIEGDTKLQKVVFDKAALLTAILALANGTVAGASPGEQDALKKLGDPTGNPATLQVRLDQHFVTPVFEKTKQFVEQFQTSEGGGIIVTDTGQSPFVSIGFSNTEKFTASGTRILGEAPADNTAGIRGVVLPGATGGQYGQASRNFRLSEELNPNPGAPAEMFLSQHLRVEAWEVNDLAFNSLTNFLAGTIVHEIGHTLGMQHTEANGVGIVVRNMKADDPKNDVMRSTNRDNFEEPFYNIPGDPGHNPDFDKGFKITDSAFRIALGLEWTEDDAQKAFEYSNAYFLSVASVDTSPTSDHVTDVQPPLPPLNAGWFAIKDPAGLPIDTLELGTVVVDGVGGAVSQTSIEIGNFGDKALTIKTMQVVAGESSSVQFTPQLTPGQVLQPQEVIPVTITFDPTTSGDRSFIIRFHTDAVNPEFDLRVSANGLSPSGDIRLERSNTNAGGLALGDAPRQVNQIATVKNIGSQPLEVYDVGLVRGGEQFAIGGVQNRPSTDNPLVIQPGGSQELGLVFDAKELGLHNGEVQILTDDPDTPIITFFVMGTGLDDSGPSAALRVGEDHVVLQVRHAAEQRLVSGVDGSYGFHATPGQSYLLTIFDPQSGLLARHAGTVPADGKVTDANFRGVWGASEEPDTDNNGVPDDIDLALGTGLHQQSSLGGAAPTSGAFVPPPSSPLIAPDPARPT